MMTTEMENAIRAAVAEAIASLGVNYKGMSCFLYNWRSSAPETSVEEKLAA